MHTVQLPFLLALSLIPSALSSPLPASGSAPPRHAGTADGTILPITHRSALLSHPILSARTDDYIPIFDSAAADLVRREISAVKNKYSKAAQYLAGVQVAEADVSFQQPSAPLPVQAAQSGKYNKQSQVASISGSSTSSSASSAGSITVSNAVPTSTATATSTFLSSTMSASTMSSAPKSVSTGASINAPNSPPASGVSTAPEPAASGLFSGGPIIDLDDGGVFNMVGGPLFAPVIGSHTSSSVSQQPMATSSFTSTSSFVSSANPPTVHTTTTSSVAAAFTPVFPHIVGAVHVPAGLTDLAVRGRTGGSPVVSLTDYISGSLDVLYYGNVNIGSPAQTLTVDFDTGSADLWLPVGCSNCQSQQFDSSKSSSYRQTGQTFQVEYGSGSVSGQLSTETVGLANTQISGQYFGAVSSESSDFQGNPNSGVLGMAFSAISSSGKPTYFENLISTKSVSSPLFGFHLTRRQAQGSQLCIGCYDSSKFTGSIFWLPVISQTYWSISMTSFSANGGGSNALSSSLIGAIDTGTTLIYVPTGIADAFYAQIPGSSKADQYGAGFYQFPCKGPANVQLGFNGRSFALNNVDFNLGRTGSGSNMCVGAVLAVSGGFPDNLAIVGDAFLKSWYSIYDYSNNVRVGLASSTNNK